MLFLLIYNRMLRKSFYYKNVMEINLQSFTYEELIQATDGFAEELGRGVLSIVCKGVKSTSLFAIS